MAKLTREQLTRWNAKLSNGFQFDLRHFAVWGEKDAVRNINLDDGKVLQAKISWRKVYDGFRSTGQVHPQMHLSIWTPTGSGMMSSSGLGATIELTDKTFSKKSWNELAKFTAEWDDERIMAEAKKHMEQINNPRVI